MIIQIHVKIYGKYNFSVFLKSPSPCQPDIKSFFSSSVTTCRKHRQRIRNLLIKLFVRHLTSVYLMEHFSVTDNKTRPALLAAFTE